MDGKRDIDDFFTEHLLTHPPTDEKQVGDPTIIQHIVSMPVDSPKQQFICLSSISNYHWLPYPESQGSSHQLINPKSHVGYNRQLLHKPSGSHTTPTSPRNRLMYYLTMEDSFVPSLLVKRYLMIDQDEIKIDSDLTIETEEIPARPRKKQKHQNRIVSVTLKDISQHTGEDLNSLLNSANQHRTLYQKFKEELRMEGIIKWRHHDFNSDVCMMTDYNSINGNIIPSSYVHVKRESTQDGNPIISCTCDIYKHLRGIAYSQHPGEENVDLFPDTTMTCMHCRYFHEELNDAYNTLMTQNTNLPWSLQEVHNSLQHMNSPIQLAGSVIERGTTKFSVKGDDETLSFVHISFQQGKCYAKCMGGICSIELQGKKKLPRLHPITETPNLCSHMKRIVQEIDHIKSFFPFHFDINNEIVPGNQAEEAVNTDDAGLSPKEVNFNRESGLWEYQALSTHKPKEMMDQSLINHTELRNKFATSGKIDTETGLRIYHLKPKNRDEEGNQRKCECGSVFDEANCYEEVQRSILYTRISPLTCICYNMKCVNRQCEIKFTEPAEERGIFFYTGKTAVADEVGWDFVRAVQNMRTSFRGFCAEMTMRYSGNQCPAYPFMSGNTFISYFFAWLSSFQIDFRKHIDPKCGHNPRILACDGTHIGVSAKNMKLEYPVTKPDIDIVLESRHHRKQRALIPNSTARKYLKYFCKKILRKLKTGEEKIGEEEEIMENFVSEEVTKMDHPALMQAINLFFSDRMNSRIHIPFAKVLLMMSGDAPLLSVFPFRSHQCIRHVINSIVTTNQLGDKILELKKYNGELVKLFSCAVETNNVPVIVSWITYILRRIEHLHYSCNRPVPQIEEIPNSYDPTKGVAYYFTESGNQL